MKKVLLILLTATLIASCGSSKKSRTVSVEGSPETNKEVRHKSKKASKEADKIIKTALSYNGTPYKYGGTTKRGMDCSGLIYTSFKENDVALQRASYMMATEGKKISLKHVEEGDLLFFTTNKNSRRINHVGLVVSVKGKDIQFIHSTSSRGVLVSSLSEGYWNFAFNHARRVL
ncbi:C40 family peptidase [Galbibacter mesophilus]|uniref:C40 family peptidase n=1 Tax=Galbibacter mesophilus TaxID=379069 RepID=UPI00191E08DF|nr:C40 family peptidase [Galbibacter mesophilus]MCM5662639.1 C40 family peptidase [Galbibacter mesophilus]